MDFPQGAPSPYYFDEIVNNNIGAVGCSYLSYANMRKLSAIGLGIFVEKQAGTRWMGEPQKNLAGYFCVYVDDNEIGEKGCKHISKAAWMELEGFNLVISL